MTRWHWYWVGIAALALISAFDSIAIGFSWLLGGLLVAGILKACQALNARDKRKALIADCDSQHRAFLEGDDDWGLFGIRPEPKPPTGGGGVARPGPPAIP